MSFPTRVSVVLLSFSPTFSTIIFLTPHTFDDVWYVSTQNIYSKGMAQAFCHQWARQKRGPIFFLGSARQCGAGDTIFLPYRLRYFSRMYSKVTFHLDMPRRRPPSTQQCQVKSLERPHSLPFCTEISPLVFAHARRSPSDWSSRSPVGGV